MCQQILKSAKVAHGETACGGGAQQSKAFWRARGVERTHPFGGSLLFTAPALLGVATKEFDVMRITVPDDWHRGEDCKCLIQLVRKLELSAVEFRRSKYKKVAGEGGPGCKYMKIRPSGPRKQIRKLPPRRRYRLHRGERLSRCSSQRPAAPAAKAQGLRQRRRRTYFVSGAGRVLGKMPN